ncbi:MAG TPA: 3-deoxy-manno-octulosonate-8-phosphatase KdsC [Burkholderiales bacterium]|nr:3-deoxy-manno-octulosonate-8-phosphatase KdsC [Burkholderiales bacterium]
MQDAFEKAKRIRLAIFDVDGVLTDGSLYISDSGEEYKSFNTLDGHGMRMLKQSGVELVIISGRTSRCVEMRAKNLGIGLLYQGVEDKLEVYSSLLTKFGLNAEATAYVGDDVMDLPVMRRCGLAICVPESTALVKQHAHYITQQPGGRGAVREICELIMQAQGTFQAQMLRYLK